MHPTRRRCHDPSVIPPGCLGFDADYLRRRTLSTATIVLSADDSRTRCDMCGLGASTTVCIRLFLKFAGLGCPPRPCATIFSGGPSGPRIFHPGNPAKSASPRRRSGRQPQIRCYDVCRTEPVWVRPSSVSAYPLRINRTAVMQLPGCRQMHPTQYVVSPGPSRPPACCAGPLLPVSRTPTRQIFPAFRETLCIRLSARTCCSLPVRDIHIVCHFSDPAQTATLRIRHGSVLGVHPRHPGSHRSTESIETPFFHLRRGRRGSSRYQRRTQRAVVTEPPAPFCLQQNTPAETRLFTSLE